MLTNLKNIFKVPDLRNKVLFTLAIIVLYRFGAHLPVPGIDFGALTQLQSPGRDERRPRLPAAVLRRRAHPVRRLRARDHAVHHRVDHHADPRRGDPQARAVAEAGRGRPAQDHPVDPLRHHRHRHPAVHRPRATCSTTAAAGSAAATPPASTSSPTSTCRHVLLIVLTLTAGTALVMWMGELDHPAGHRQRHVAADLRLGGRRPARQWRPDPGQGRLDRSCSSSLAGYLVIAGGASCSSSRASAASRCSSPNGWSAGACTAARAPTSR